MDQTHTLQLKEQRMGWWREAKFGMFIHWGLYAIPAGKWKGRAIPGIGEWIMKRAQIPAGEYAMLAREFNPVAFDAKAWVDAAVNAGMKYIVITAKHHDGFAMYRSKASDYNITHASPFRRDPMKELAEQCAKAGLKLCFYYSQTQDWYEKDAVGNDWDFPEPSDEDFQSYLDRKVKPQLQELLTGYGPIGLIWFDTPRSITEAQSRELADFVHKLQPDCIVNGRVGNGLGDYLCLGDNETPATALAADWETCATLNHTWGYKTDDQSWKSPETLIRLLSDIVGKGGTYLLNVGPTAEGVIPQPSVNVLSEVGEWLKVNAEAIYGTQANPFATEFDWGTITTRPGKVYVHLFERPKETLALHGLKNRVRKAHMLADPQSELEFEQTYDESTDTHALRVSLPKQIPVSAVTVLALDIDGAAEADNTLAQQADGHVMLEAHRSVIHGGEAGAKACLSKAGVLTDWSDENEWLSWEFKVTNPGTFHLRIRSLAEKARDAMGETIGRWEGGHRLQAEVAGQQLEFDIVEHSRVQNARSAYFHRIHTECGSVSIDRPGTYTFKLKAIKLNYEQQLGLKLVSVDLLLN
ncbi:alpha-L-fucosidase [Paenibacillus arenilitoris]|uniref:alpha-L-fucosidase n=1 Tax=Paenibacillus arenilitoris TaxID=2772299 RepID=A0A927H6X8_9BACL|nr:alpha-L-fucosidase [Paenibacillus arenilitoris]MBD2870048.1 alpha-L-fucosidase [Paenibacillus arenilitoris]